MSHLATSTQLSIIVLAAGFGTRMQEVTQGKIPKGLLRVGDEYVVSYLLNQALDTGFQFDSVTLVSNKRYEDQFAEYCDEYSGTDIELLTNTVVSNEIRNGAVTDLIWSIDQHNLWHHHLLVLPSDTIGKVDFKAMIEQFLEAQHKQPTAFTTVHKIGRERIANSLGNPTLNNSGQITNFVEKPAHPSSDWASAPIYILPSDVLRIIQYTAEQQGTNVDSPGVMIPWLLENEIKVQSFPITHYTDIGTPEKYHQAQNSDTLHKINNGV